MQWLLSENVIGTSEDKQKRPEKREGRLTADKVREIMENGTLLNLAGHCVDFAFCSEEVGRLCWALNRVT